jgi:aryl-alcohol dehydrogenase-like predicted oxidoreductase
MREDSNGGGLSRKSIAYEIDCSLRRLRTDYLDLYQIHRWDPDTPIEETLEVLTDLVRCGKVRYIGASSMFSWQFCKALYLSKLYRWSSFVSMQPHYNLLNREAERELLPLCEDQGIGVLPYSPLARGRLARPWEERKGTDRSRVDTVGTNLYDGCEDADRVVVEQVGLIAEARGVSRAQIATAWLLHKPIVTAPLIGATRVGQLEETVAAESLHLEESEIHQLEVHYTPHKLLF